MLERFVLYQPVRDRLVLVSRTPPADRSTALSAAQDTPRITPFNTGRSTSTAA